MRPVTIFCLFALSGCSGVSRVGELEAGLSVCAHGTVVNGVDVSHYDGAIGWPSVKAAGYQFAIMKATEQTSFVDPTFAANWKQAGDAGIIRGAYHFFRPSYDPIQQADFFVETAGVPAAGDLPPTIDLEVTDSLMGAQVAQGALQFLERVAQKTGRKPIIYSSARVFTELGDPTGFESYTLWVANWQVTCPKIPSPEWSDWSFWQNSATATVAGISGNVDVDQFNGTLDELRTLAGAPAPAADAADVVADAGGEPAPPAMTGSGCSMAPRPGSPAWLPAAGMALLLIGSRRRSGGSCRAARGSPARRARGARDPLR